MVDIARTLQHDIARRSSIIGQATGQGLAHGYRDVVDQITENLARKLALPGAKLHIRELPGDLRRHMRP